MTDLLRWALLVPAAWCHAVGTWLCELAGAIEHAADDNHQQDDDTDLW